MRSLILLAALLATTSPVHAALTLIQRSNGLSTPLLEEGKTEFELGDVNGDGELDLLSVGDHGNPGFNSDEHGVLCWIGDGVGNWTFQQTGNFGYGGCGLGDLNRDGLLDIAWGVHHDYGSGGFGDRLLGAALGNGTGASWTPWDSGLATSGETWGMFATDLADFDGDGLLDLVSLSFGSGNGIRVYANDGDGTWTHAASFPGGNSAYTLETGDVNGDGWLDVAASWSLGTILLGDGALGFAPANAGLASSSVRAVDLGDFDRDGRDDLLVALGSSGVRVYRFDLSTSTWVSSSTGLPATGSVEMVQFGDVSGDGELDVVSYTAPTGRIWLGDGAGNWTADTTWTMPAPGSFSALRVDGDVDHDGRDDIVVSAIKSGFPFSRNQLRVYSAFAEPPALDARVEFPRGGETLRIGSIREISWRTAVPLGPATVDLYCSLDGDAGPWSPIALDLPDNGRYEWLVDVAPTEQARFEVRVHASGGSVAASSTSDVRIVPGNVTAAPVPVANADRLRVSPNPWIASATVSWSSTNALSSAAVGIVRTIDGREVHRQAIAGDWRLGRDLPAGIYWIELRDGNRRFETKTVKLR